LLLARTSPASRTRFPRPERGGFPGACDLAAVAREAPEEDRVEAELGVDALESHAVVHERAAQRPAVSAFEAVLARDDRALQVESKDAALPVGVEDDRPAPVQDVA